jgi:ribosomal protein L7/L12
MKLDKIKFVKVVGYIQRQFAISMSDYEMRDFDDLIDVDIPEPVANKASCFDVDNLLMLMNEGTRKIESIKAYRTLTGAGLKESKDAVEKYWSLRQLDSYAKITDKKKSSEPTTLGGILGHATGRTKAGNDISGI